MNIQWAIGTEEFDTLMSSKKESVPGPDGLPYSVYMCAGGIGSGERRCDLQ